MMKEHWLAFTPVLVIDCCPIFHPNAAHHRLLPRFQIFVARFDLSSTEPNDHIKGHAEKQLDFGIDNAFVSGFQGAGQDR